MKLFILFGQRNQSYEGEYAPETLVCWEEFSVEENPEGFEGECDAAREKNKNDFSAFRVIHVNVDGDKIDRLLNKTPVVKGDIES